jgi:hypothetical protein
MKIYERGKKQEKSGDKHPSAPRTEMPRQTRKRLGF